MAQADRNIEESAGPEGSDSSRSGPPTWACAVLLAAVSGGLFLLGARSLPLADPEESRCAAVVQHMLQSGDYLMPRLGTQLVVRDGAQAIEMRPYYEKPAPFFWLAAGAQKAAGSVELGGRLVAALSGVLAVLAIFGIARSLAGNWAGLLAGLVLATSVEFFFLARWYRMDMPFAAFMAMALWWLWRYESRLIAGAAGGQALTVSRGGRAAKWLGFYALCALAVLMKGPAGLVLPGAIVLLYLLLCRTRAGIAELLAWALPGLAVFLAVAAPYYVAGELKHRGFAYEFLVNQNVARFGASGAVDSHTPPAIVYVPILLVGLLPWTVYLPGAIIRSMRRRKAGSDGNWVNLPLGLQAPRGMVFLWLGALVPLAFFMAASTRLPNYILPCFGPLAAITAVAMARWAQSREPDPLYRHGARGMLVTLAVMLAGIALAEAVLPRLDQAPLGGRLSLWMQWALAGTGLLDGWIALPAAIVAVCAACGWSAIRKSRRSHFVAWVIVGTAALYVYAVVHLAPWAYGDRSYRDVALRLRAEMPAQAQVFAWRSGGPSLGVYTNRTDCSTLYRKDPEDLIVLHLLVQSGRPLYAVLPTRSVRKGEDPGQYLRELEQASGRRFTPAMRDSHWAAYQMLPTGRPVEPIRAASSPLPAP